MSSKKIQWESYNLPKKQVDNTDFDEHNEDKLPKILETPFGYFQVDDTMNPIKQFQCVIANTNFPVTKKIKSTINAIEGVEVLIIISRYKFIIGVGKLFDVNVIQKNIEKIICNDKTQEVYVCHDIIKRVEKLKNNLVKTQLPWSIYLFPNGNLDYEIRNEGQKSIFPIVRNISGGILIESEKLKNDK